MALRNTKPKLTPIFLAAWTVLLSLTWLIPYHFDPWTAFHSDAWMGFMLAIATVVLVAMQPGQVSWPASACVIAIALLVPWVQFLTDLIPFAGEAWTTSLYLLGFLFSILLGSHWEHLRRDECFTAMGSAILIAALISVWLQLGHWFQIFDVGLRDTWTMGLSGDRPYANLGQPNQLATLLVWALLVCLWLHLRGVLSSATAVAITTVLLVGVALTQSRTGALEVLAVVAALLIWRRLWPTRSTQWTAVALLGFYGMCVYGLPQLREALLLGQDTSFERYGRTSDLRLPAWQLFWQAIEQRPWVGHGWTQLRHAQIAVAGNTKELQAVFASSHNLFLDAALWLGLPLALLGAGLSCWWLVSVVRKIDGAPKLILVIFLCTVLIHAMLEFPLQYAYMLLPFGMVVGILDARCGWRVVFKMHRAAMLLLATAGILMLAVTTRDYLLVERAYVAMRLVNAKLVAEPSTPLAPPEVLVLTQFREWFRFVRFASHPGMSPEQIKWVETITMYYPTPSALYRMAVTLVINNRAPESVVWLKRLCAITDVDTCARFRAAWEKEAKTNPDVAKIGWPS